jgi:uncharacterized protein (UPF0332 family)
MDALENENELHIRGPDLVSAIHALRAASELLNSATSKFNERDYHAAFLDSRDAMRTAASALLLKDGYIAGTFEVACLHLSKRYNLHIDDWHAIENTITGDGPGLFNMIMKQFTKKKTKKEAKKAMDAATRFLVSVDQVLKV